MPIVVNLDVMMAKRKMSLNELSARKGAPVRMVPSTRRPCHKITAVQMPQNSRNRARTTSYTPAVHTQPQLRTNAIPTRRGTSSGFS